MGIKREYKLQRIESGLLSNIIKHIPGKSYGDKIRFLYNQYQSNNSICKRIEESSNVNIGLSQEIASLKGELKDIRVDLDYFKDKIQNKYKN